MTLWVRALLSGLFIILMSYILANWSKNQIGRLPVNRVKNIGKRQIHFASYFSFSKVFIKQQNNSLVKTEEWCIVVKCKGEILKILSPCFFYCLLFLKLELKIVKYMYKGKMSFFFFLIPKDLTTARISSK